MVFPKSFGRIVQYSFAISSVVITICSSVSADPSTQAIRLGDRLGGFRLTAGDALTAQVASLIIQGKAEQAANLLTGLDSFYNVTVEHMFCPMSNRPETPIVLQPNGNFGCMTDFVATGIGIVRDNVDARELLTGNYIYQGQAGLANVRATQNDLYKSNNHFADLESTGQNYAQVLTKVAPQMVYNAQGATVPVAATDAAGLLTTRTWGEQHYVAGTNRRVVEFASREFLCNPLKDIGDEALPDDMTARDVDRQPSGSVINYKTTCAHCHNIHDPWHYATSFFEWIQDGSGNYLIYTPGTVQAKLTKNGTMYPNGYVT